jgi:predicted nucleic-acid-binding protein
MDSSNVVVNQPVVEAGLAILDKGGDFADGAIAYEGRWLGAEEFVSFDKQAVSLLRSQGRKTRLLS